MQYWDNVLYPAFRATINGTYYGYISQDALDEECYYLACRAISTFKFPKISLDYETFYAIRLEDNVLEEVNIEDYPNAVPHGAFKEDINYNEKEVIIAWMKVYWIENLLSNADNFEDIYTDNNIKTFSKANLIDKNTKLLKEARKTAQDAENRYGRVNNLRRSVLGEINNE